MPSIFGVWAASPDLRIGIGITSPFGQKINYSEAWLGRYFETSSELKTVNFMGSAAWRVSSALSIGGGLEYQTADVKRNSAIDFGSACFGALGPAACAGLGILPQTQDGAVKFDASSHAVGYNLGLLLEPRDGLRFGVTYRSKVKHNLSGTATFSVPAAASFLTAGGAFRSTGSSTEITLPESISLGLAADLSPRATLLAGLIWTRSSRFSSLIIRFDNPAQPTVIEPQYWKNNYRASLGFDYRLNPALTMHGGLVFDQSPVPDSFRNVTIPDSDRVSISTGLTWKPSDALSLTVSYSHSHDKDAPITQSSPSSGALSGVFKRDIDVLGLQAGWRF